MTSFNRRDFLATLGRAAVIGAATPYVLHVSPASAKINSQVPGKLRTDSARVFDLSIASGDPSAHGVMLWTHLRSDAIAAGSRLFFQIALDSAFSKLVVEGEVPAATVDAESDFTVRVDIEGPLAPATRYYYRFVYGDTTSRVGRCRTLPVGTINSLKLAIITCQDYTNGYYGAFKHLAADDSVDFVVHVGDFIYESAADPRFQTLPFADRMIVLPSGASVVQGLADYRSIYRTYRGDANLQRVLEQHTWIFSHDDHETANDCYWDYERDTLGAPDHPFKNDVGALRQLKLDSMRAWLEYTPVRVEADEGAVHPHDYYRDYREFVFGDLVRLSMLDTRSYRTHHPCGEGDFLQRYLPVGCSAFKSPSQTMMGAEQADWLVDRLSQTDTIFNVVGNQTLFSRLSVAGSLPIDVDAWDGYDAERRWLTQQLVNRNVKNLVMLTGDLHSYVASHVKLDYGNINPFDTKNLVGVEFMTPSVTSASLFDTLLKNAGSSALGDGLSEAAVRLNNPHLKFFNSSKHGYSTITFARDQCEWIAYAIDKNASADSVTRQAISRLRKYTWWPYLLEQSTSGY